MFLWLPESVFTTGGALDARVLETFSFAERFAGPRSRQMALYLGASRQRPLPRTGTWKSTATNAEIFATLLDFREGCLRALFGPNSRNQVSGARFLIGRQL